MVIVLICIKSSNKLLPNSDGSANRYKEFSKISRDHRIKLPVGGGVCGVALIHYPTDEVMPK